MGAVFNKPGNMTENVMGFGSVARGPDQPSKMQNFLGALGSGMQGVAPQGGDFQPGQMQGFDVMGYLNSIGFDPGLTSLSNVQVGGRY